LTPAELALVADPAAAEPWTLRDSTSQPHRHPVRFIACAQPRRRPGLSLAGGLVVRTATGTLGVFMGCARRAELPAARGSRRLCGGARQLARSFRRGHWTRPGTLARWRRENRGSRCLCRQARATSCSIWIFERPAPAQSWRVSLVAESSRSGRPSKPCQMKVAVASKRWWLWAHVPDGDEIEGLTATIEATPRCGTCAPPAQAPPQRTGSVFRLYVCGRAPRTSRLFE